jgi:hypothetical protein
MMEVFSLDPAVPRMLGAAVSIILLTGALDKLRDLDSFRAVLENYRLLPASLVALVASALPLLEATAGLALLTEAGRGFGALLAFLLLATVTAAVVINLLRGRHQIECGCGGSDGRQTLSWALVARNALLLAAALGGAAADTARDLLWLDYLSVAGGALALFGLYASANQLLANQPHLIKTRR